MDALNKPYVTDSTLSVFVQTQSQAMEIIEELYPDVNTVYFDKIETGSFVAHKGWGMRNNFTVFFNVWEGDPEDEPIL